MYTIVQDGDPVLDAEALPVAEEEFGTSELTGIVDGMAQALDKEPDGVALAAPQVGVSKRIFIVRYDRLVTPPEGESPAPHLGVYINPEFIKASRRQVEMDEGCLSVRGVYGKTIRHDRATVRARTADGARFERGGGGILAQVFQHEIDHLNGILFVDHAHEQFEVHRGDAHHHEE
ncbi:MAG: peptide deformylase [Parcubacteria bacterium C7867-007]|nr:MAG: peptide deformylase [Parcubacteria bacterium C7867-007]